MLTFPSSVLIKILIVKLPRVSKLFLECCFSPLTIEDNLKSSDAD